MQRQGKSKTIVIVGERTAYIFTRAPPSCFLCTQKTQNARLTITYVTKRSEQMHIDKYNYVKAKQ